MGEVDGLSLTLIDLYVPTLTLRLQRGDTALNFSQNLTLFAICCIYTCIIGKEGYVDPLGFESCRLYTGCIG